MNTLPEEKPRVLVVDDQKNWRETLCDTLDSTAYEIETATNYDEAKSLLRQRAFHVLVSDQRLVDADDENIQGILLLDEVAELRDGTETIIVTGYPTIKDAREALRGRHAYDYLLKYPEERGPFKIREYRERVKEAAEKAKQERQKAVTLHFSVSDLVKGLTYDQIAEALFPGKRVKPEVRKVVNEVVNRLLYLLQPLARGMGSARLSEVDQIYEILCWSRGYGKAALVRTGKEQSSLKDAYKADWLVENWHLVKNNEFASVPFRGVSYVIDGMTFEEFTSLVGEK
jgi:response regulator RpfG family c-di-GMP phosphodiesterase